jgi:hypothetical protein
MTLRTISLLGALALATPAFAQNVASFVVSNDDGYGVDTCLENGSACGQPIATEWCVANGYTKAIDYRKQDAADITGSISGPTRVAAVPPHAVVITCEK